MQNRRGTYFFEFLDDSNSNSDSDSKNAINNSTNEEINNDRSTNVFHQSQAQPIPDYSATALGAHKNKMHVRQGMGKEKDSEMDALIAALNIELLNKTLLPPACAAFNSLILAD
jgi:hypothetical protein